MPGSEYKKKNLSLALGAYTLWKPVSETTKCNLHAK